jgi:hypothetical protein
MLRRSCDVKTGEFAGEVGFRMEVIYADVDLIELSVSGWNGAFGDSTALYLSISGLEKLRRKLQDFLKTASDVRDLVLGSFERKFAGGGVSLRFYCQDRAGHAYGESRIESGAESAGVMQVVTLSMPVEAAAVDRFAEELRRLEKDKSGVAILEGRG